MMMWGKKGQCGRRNRKEMDDRGFSLVELLIALTIFAVGILAVAAMQTAALRGKSQSTTLTQAVRDITQDKIEALLSLAYSNSSLTDGDHPSSSTYEETVSGGVTYNTRWTVDEDTTKNMKTVLVTTTWTDLSGSHTVNATFVKDGIL